MVHGKTLSDSLWQKQGINRNHLGKDFSSVSLIGSSYYCLLCIVNVSSSFLFQSFYKIGRALNRNGSFSAFLFRKKVYCVVKTKVFFFFGLEITDLIFAPCELDGPMELLFSLHGEVCCHSTLPVFSLYIAHVLSTYLY